MKRTPFSQAEWLDVLAKFGDAQAASPESQAGVCFGLCLLWLKMMDQSLYRSPEERMKALGRGFKKAISWQLSYRRLAQQLEVAPAVVEMGRRAGLAMEEQTVVERRLARKTGMVLRIQRDLELPGAGAMWSLQFPVGAHAIAGRNTFAKVTTNIHVRTIHVFDPNLGEYVGQPHDIPAIVEDMFRRIPAYDAVVTMFRDRVESLDTSGTETTQVTSPYAFTSERGSRR
jgi:hypothetical protein